MATLILTNPLVALGDLDVSGDLNQVQLEYALDEVDDTRFGMNTHAVAPDPLATVNGSMSGRWEGGDGNVDDRLFANLGAIGNLSLTPTRGDGDTAYLMQTVRMSYQPSGAIGERFNFEASLSARGDLIRGHLLHDAQVTASGTGSAVDVGTVGSDETLYAALHVVAASGTSPTLDVKIESDDASGFSSPVDRITFDQATDRTSQWKTLDGAVADNFFRVNHTVGGTNPDFLYIVTIGIR